MFEPVGHLALRSNCEKAWFGWPCDEAIEKLRAEFTMIPDLDGRKAHARAVQLRAIETVPYVPVGQFYLVRGYRKDLTGLLVQASRSTGASAAAGDRRQSKVASPLVDDATPPGRLPRGTHVQQLARIGSRH